MLRSNAKIRLREGLRSWRDRDAASAPPRAAAGRPAKLVIASASSTTARSPESAAKTISQVASPTPTPGPIANAFRRRSARNSASSSAPSTGRTMTARLAAALTASASRGLAIVTSPAPARNAPRAASRAAPVDHEGPGGNDHAGRGHTCARSTAAWENARAKARGCSRRSSAQLAASTLSGIPMSATETRPQYSRPGRRRCPGFLRKNVTVREALTAAPMTAPDVPLIPLGKSTARIGAGLRVHPFDHRTRQTVDRPIEASAEQGVDHDVSRRQTRGSAAIDRAGPFLGSKRGVALDPFGLADKH